MKLPIGCDANSRTSSGNPLSDELGLDGHNHFEADASLTRDDYFLGNGDDYTWNSTVSTPSSYSRNSSLTISSSSRK